MIEFSLLIKDKDDYDDIKSIKVIDKSSSLYWEVMPENIVFGNTGNRKQRLVNFKIYLQREFTSGNYEIEVSDLDFKKDVKEISLMDFKYDFKITPKLKKDKKGVYKLENKEELKKSGYQVQIIFQESLLADDNLEKRKLKRVSFSLPKSDKLIPFKTYKAWSIYFYLEKKGLNTFLLLGPYN